MSGARLLHCGERAVLVELDTPAARRALQAALAGERPDGIVEAVPGASTVLVRVETAARLAVVASWVRGLSLDVAVPAETGDEVRVEVSYDGPDLADTADLLGMSPEALIVRHTGTAWTVDFVGFAPGFGYLTAAEPFDVPRRESPRTRIPAGSVGLAGAYTGVYPRRSSGGWQLIGTARTPTWNPEADEPALFVPGRRVRFVAV